MNFVKIYQYCNILYFIHTYIIKGILFEVGDYELNRRYQSRQQ